MAMTKNEENWNRNYELLKAFILKTGHLPAKRKVENRGLLNWWKYNQKLIRQNRQTAERSALLKELGNMRSSVRHDEPLTA